MIEAFIAGIVLGAIIMRVFASWSFNHTIKYKARTGIDMCIKGVFYTVRYNNERNRGLPDD